MSRSVKGGPVSLPATPPLQSVLAQTATLCPAACRSTLTMTCFSRALLAATALAYPAGVLAARQLAVRTYAPVAKQASSANVVSSNVLTLKKSKKAAKSAGYLGSLRTGIVSSSSNYSYGAEPIDNLYSEEYVAEIEWDGTSIEVIVDTGSSDTWLVQAGFTCVDVDGNVQPVSVHPVQCLHLGSRPKVSTCAGHSPIFLQEADCYFGPVFNGTFDEGSIADENFSIEYGDGEFLTGVFGYENVTVAGITVDKQQVALVNYSYWFGDSETSGLMVGHLKKNISARSLQGIDCLLRIHFPREIALGILLASRTIHLSIQCTDMHAQTGTCIPAAHKCIRGYQYDDRLFGHASRIRPYHYHHD